MSTPATLPETGLQSLQTSTTVRPPDLERSPATLGHCLLHGIICKAPADADPRRRIAHRRGLGCRFWAPAVRSCDMATASASSRRSLDMSLCVLARLDSVGLHVPRLMALLARLDSVGLHVLRQPPGLMVRFGVSGVLPQWVGKRRCRKDLSRAMREAGEQGSEAEGPKGEIGSSESAIAFELGPPGTGLEAVEEGTEVRQGAD